MIIRKCIKGELDKIIDVADKAFIPDRDANFTFRRSVPSIYCNADYDYSDIHYVVEDDGEFIAVAGNYITEININNMIYKFSKVGTVGTLKEHRENGYMKQLMRAINYENEREDVIFSVLYGDRNRYKNYGYEKCGLSHTFTFKSSQEKYLNNKYNVQFKEYNHSDLDIVYSIYKSNEIFVLRNKNNFELCLNEGKSKLFTVYTDKIIGYFAVKKDRIIEINLTDNKYLEGLLKEILVNTDNELEIDCNSLKLETCKVLEQLADSSKYIDKLNIKVYDFKKFFKLLFDINEKILSIGSFSEKYTIDNKTYLFEYKNGIFNITESKGAGLLSFDSESEFMRFALGNSAIYSKISKVFPLLFDFNEADKF